MKSLPVPKYILLTLGLAVVALVAALPSSAAAQTPEPPPRIDALFFYSTGCTYCQAEGEFLEALETAYPSLVVHEFEISEPGNARLFTDLAAACGEKPYSVPVLFIDQKMLTGFLSPETTGRDIEKTIQTCLEVGCEDPRKALEPSLGPPQTQSQPECEAETEEGPTTLKVPLLGTVNLHQLSLPTLTILLGILDGFNPCAMWALMFLIALLINTRSRKKMWAIGGTFILTSGVVYFLFMAAWLNFFLLVGLVDTTRILIGIVAIAAGFIQLRNYFSGAAETCKVTHSKLKQSAMDRIKQLTQPTALPATLAGVAVLAFTVNLVELFCSLGLPAIYTRTLSLHQLPTPVYYGYLALYVIIFMIDDFFIFVIATATLTSTAISTKYSKYATLVGGLLILSLGFILILKPELLMR